MHTTDFMPDEATFAAFGELRDDEPVVMLNLLRFKPERGRGDYRKYGQEVMPMLLERGARAGSHCQSGLVLAGSAARGEWYLEQHA
jgi:hypothetical protein